MTSEEDGSGPRAPNLQPTCSVCLCPIAITATGLIRQHGPIKSHCPGLRLPPGTSTMPRQPPTEPQDHVEGEATASTSPEVLPLQKASVRVLKRLPKGSRECAARKLASILDAVVKKNDHTLWARLLLFTARCLRHPGREGRGLSLATAVNRQLREETDPPANEKPIHSCRNGHLPSISSSELARLLAA